MAKRPPSSTLRTYRSRPQVYHTLAPGEEPRSARVTLDLNAETIANLDALKKNFGDATNTEVIRRSLRLQREVLSGSEAQATVASRRQSAKKAPSTTILISNRKKIINYATILITALQEALDYDPLRQHNSKPPALFQDDKAYLADVKSLIAELNRLNNLLEKTTGSKAKAKTAVDLKDHLNLFLKNYAKHLGTGAAVLTTGVIGALLAHMGFDDGISNILHHFK